jgi:hypothetical protein
MDWKNHKEPGHHNRRDLGARRTYRIRKEYALSDIELLASADTPSKRTVLINDDIYEGCRSEIIAQLSQTMNFVMDTTVEDFLHLHASSRTLVLIPLYLSYQPGKHPWRRAHHPQDFIPH